MRSGSETSSGYRRTGSPRVQESKIFKQKPLRMTTFYQFCVFYCFSVALTSHLPSATGHLYPWLISASLPAFWGNLELGRIFTFILYDNKAFSQNLCVLNTTHVTQLIYWCLILMFDITEHNQGRNTQVQRSRAQNNPILSVWARGTLGMTKPSISSRMQETKPSHLLLSWLPTQGHPASSRAKFHTKYQFWKNFWTWKSQDERGWGCDL